MRLCRIVAVPFTFQTLLAEQLRCIAASGLDLTMVCNPGPELNALAADVGARGHGISMQRRPAPLADLASLVKLTRLLIKGGFDIVHSVTPKAGFLTALAGTIARVPIRLHTFTGQPWVELTGLSRRIPRECDRITARLMTQCYADSPSQREFLLKEGLVAPSKITVIGAGSIAGVDLGRFSPGAWGRQIAAETRRELGIPANGLVILFVGRVTKDKGVTELVDAFRIISEKNEGAHLLLVGPFEPELDPLPPKTLDLLKRDRRIHCVGFTSTPERFMAASDIMCLPSYREGFGSVIVEAGAMELPAVVTRVTGLLDTVLEGVTGLIVPAKNSVELAEALQRLANSKELRRSLGMAGRRRVIEHFDARVINAGVIAEYHRLASNASSQKKRERHSVGSNRSRH